ncbi:MAG: hypothetical protein NZ988_01230 [Thaumarchaeota archaeon]|nr:hypothetical protein [Candidatus Calditenuaceae archaeon]MDW8186656.1 hypothetical protein [Nitrososphaerota archaeon]
MNTKKTKKKYLHECRLEEIKLGEVPLAQLVNELSFIENKGLPGAYLRGTHGGPANFGRPIPLSDYQKIVDAMSSTITETPQRSEENIEEHDEIVAKILEIGSLMGFSASDAEEDTRIARGAVVDAVWKLSIANLGEIRYVFEVQLRGSVDSLILNLLRASQNPTVRACVVISDPDQLERIKDETTTLSEDFKKKLRFLSIKEINDAYNLLKTLTGFREKIGLQI